VSPVRTVPRGKRCSESMRQGRWQGLDSLKSAAPGRALALRNQRISPQRGTVPVPRSQGSCWCCRELLEICRAGAAKRSTDFKEFRSLVPRCPQLLCMTYTQGMGNLWIKKPFTVSGKTIHSFPPIPRVLYTGGFRCTKTLEINQITLFSTRSGPTITTML